MLSNIEVVVYYIYIWIINYIRYIFGVIFHEYLGINVQTRYKFESWKCGNDYVLCYKDEFIISEIGDISKVVNIVEKNFDNYFSIKNDCTFTIDPKLNNLSKYYIDIEGKIKTGIKNKWLSSEEKIVLNDLSGVYFSKDYNDKYIHIF